MRERDKVTIGWIDPGVVDGKFALSIASVFYHRGSRVDALMRVESSGLLSRGRNELVANFLKGDAQWLLMVDSDEVLEVETFDKLVATAHDVSHPIVAGLYFGAWPGEYYPTAVPLIFRANPNSTFDSIVDYPPNSVIPVDSAGTGCLLIHRSVLEKIRAEATAHEGDWCWFRDMPVNGAWFSEDHFFCARARALGFKLHAHTGATLPHRKQFWLEARHHVRPKQNTMDPRAGLETR